MLNHKRTYEHVLNHKRVAYWLDLTVLYCGMEVQCSTSPSQKVISGLEARTSSVSLCATEPREGHFMVGPLLY